jgi:hypothetical protein
LHQGGQRDTQADHVGGKSAAQTVRRHRAGQPARRAAAANSSRSVR